MHKKNIQDILALSPIQEGMLFHYLKEVGGGAYFEQLSLSIEGEIRKDRFINAWRSVVRANDVLRTCFKWQTLETPVQIVLKQHDPDIRFIDTPGDLDRVISQDRGESFDLTEVPFRITLCFLESGKYLLIISHHHILYDGWSTGIILDEFFSAYDSPEDSFAPKTPYREYVRWLRNLDQDAPRKYWRDYLEGVQQPSRLSIKRRTPPPSTSESPETVSHRVTLEPIIHQRLRDIVQSRKITLATVFYAAWGILYLKYNNSRDELFGTTVSGRSAPVKGIEKMAGLFIDTLPLRFQTTDGGREKVGNMLEALNRQLSLRRPHENTAPLQVRQAGPLGVGEELFDSLVVIENYPLQKVLSRINRPGRLRVSAYKMEESTHYDLSLGINLIGDIEIDIQAAASVLDIQAVRQISAHYARAMEQLLTNMDRGIRELDLLSPQERAKILDEFNDTSVSYPTGKTIHSLFREQAAKTPCAIAVCGTNNRSYWSYLSYKELNLQSDRLAHRLRERGAASGQVIAIKLERSLEMLIAILAILKTGSAYLPIDPEYPQDRIGYMLKDSDAILFMDAALDPITQRSGGMSRGGASPKNDSPPAYIIYTSGTTGRPKGVLVNHSSVVNRIFWLKDSYALSERDVVLQASSYIFDVSVCELFRWIPAGGRLCFLPPGGRKDPAIILDTISRQCATTADFVPAALNMLLDYAENNGKLSRLSSLRYVFTGVEAVAKDMVLRFNRTLYHRNGTVLIDAYGPTESTVDVTQFICSGGDLEEYESIPIGKPIGNVRIHILDRYGKIQPIGVYGELCISGAGLARGYLNNQELTALRFASSKLQNTNDKLSSHSRPMTVYHTGDLARWLPDGNIEFLGRLDRQVKVRGFRVELAEIESRLLTHPEISGAYVKELEREGSGAELCAYITVSQKMEDKTVREFLTASLPYYMIPAYIVFLESMPLSPSGKIDARALPEPCFQENPDRYIAPRDTIEAQLVRLYSRVLGIEEKNISVDDNFFLLGGHSLKAMALVPLIHKRLKVNTPVSQVFETPDIAGLAEYIRAASGAALSPILPVEEKEYYPLSSAQKRMFILQGMDQKNTHYNMPDALIMKGELDLKRFRQTFQRLIERHESLRTSFFIIQNQPVQRIYEQVEFEFDTVDLNGSFTTEGTEDTEEKETREALAILRDFVRPFDLSRPPLMRVKLVKLDAERYYLLVDMFHIIADGVSIGVFIRDFMALYNEEELPALAVQYKDFAQWQNGLRDAPSFKHQESWWLNQFTEMPPPLNLPLDYPRPPKQDFDGGFTRFQLEGQISARLRALAAESGVSLFMVLLAVYYILLWKLSGSRDITVGSPIAGRGRDGLEGIMGMFVNTLALRNRIQPDESFSAFLQKVKRKNLEAYQNQDYQFEDLVERLTGRRDPSRHPVFDVVFALHNVDISEIRIPGLSLTLLDYARDIALFDFYLEAEEKKETLAFKASYCSALFKHETIEAFVRYYREIIDAVITDKHIILDDIKISHDLLEPETANIQEAMGDFGF